jgi:hypothetical protein
MALIQVGHVREPGSEAFAFRKVRMVRAGTSSSA